VNTKCRKRKWRSTHPLHQRQAEDAAELINKANKRFLYVAGGRSCGSQSRCGKIARWGNIPVTTTLWAGGPREHDARSLHVGALHAALFAKLLRGAGVQIC